MIQIPSHMSECAVHGGLPVPRVVATTKGHSAITEADELSAQAGATHQIVWVPENDTPDFGKYDDTKQRQSMVERRCHVCWKADGLMLLCDPGRTATTDGQQMAFATGREYPLVKQPWVCPSCLSFACQHCPPLRKAIAERRGLVFYPMVSTLVSTFYKAVDVGDPQPPDGSRVISSIKVAVVKSRVTPLHEWALAAGGRE